jgi:LPS-assembly protein
MVPAQNEGIPAAAETPPEKDLVETVIPYKGENIVIRSREQTSEKGVFRAVGDVEILYADLVFRAQQLEYDSEARFLRGQGDIYFRKGIQEIYCDHFEFDLAAKTGVFWDTRGISDNNFHLRAERVEKVGPDVYLFFNGQVTTCDPESADWTFQASKARIIKDKTATIKNSVFRLFGIPVFYFPWVKFPILEKGRKSGLLIPVVGTSNNKGLRISQGVYLTLGRSADIVVRGDYFSKRGGGLATSFRSRFSEDSYFNFSSYAVKDNQNEGGTRINIDSFFSFGNGYRATVQANTVSNIVFRRVYDDTFFGAVRPDEVLRGDLVRDWPGFSANLILGRQQYFFSERKIINRYVPRLAFRLHGQQIGSLPGYFFLDSSFDSVYKEVEWNETDPGTGETTARIFKTTNSPLRLDVHPQYLLPVKLGGWLRLSLMPGFRTTYYSTSLPEEPPTQGNFESDPADLFRGQATMEARLDLPRVFRVYNLWGHAFKHTMEAGAVWRWISDMDDFQRLVFFDYHDAIASTNEVEYFFINRFIGRRNDQPWEWLAVILRQKYFLDHDFGGSFKVGEENQIEPLYSFSPYDALYYPRRFTPVQMIARFNPVPRFSSQFRSEYDTLNHRFSSWSVAGTYQQDWLFSSVGYLRLKPLDFRQDDSNYLQTSFSIGRDQRGLSTDISLSYNFENTNLDNIYIRLNYFTDCLGISAEFSNFDIFNRERENEFRISLFLRGIGSFGKLRGVGRRRF